MIRFLFLCITLIGVYPAFAQFNSVTPLSQIPISANTGEKPQSKVWAYDGIFWTVLPDNSGTHVWRLDGQNWTKALTLSTNTSSKVDCKVVDDVTHVFLFQGQTSELISVQYNTNESNYMLWQDRSAALKLNFTGSAETATIDIDSENRMWLAYEMSRAIRVRWSDEPYTQWSAEIILETNVDSDDICAVVALPSKIGVMWSNQRTRQYGFRTHLDGAAPGHWSTDEVPASQSAKNIGEGIADDHLNLTVASDGTLYCAIKTSYDTPDQPRIALLVRRPSGTWHDLYEIATRGTRPIVILNEIEGIVRVIYTEDDGGGDIRYKEAETSSLSFGPELTLIAGNYNNATSMKENFTDEIVILASNSSKAVGVLARTEIIPLPVELLGFTVRLAAGDAVLEWKTASEQDNYYFSVESSIDSRTFTPIGRANGNGTTQLQRNYSFTDHNISRYGAAGIYYRLRQVDYNGEFEFSPIRHVSAPALPDAITIKAFPNPFDNYLQVSITSSEEQASTIVLHNAQGRIMHSQAIALKRGINTISLNELKLAGGVYFLKVTTADLQHVKKLVSE